MQEDRPLFGGGGPARAPSLTSARTPAGHGIRLRHERGGRQRLPCPACDKGPTDDALAVTVTPRGWAFWRCWRCGWEGGAPLGDAPAERRPRPRLRPVEPRPVPAPGGLSAWARELLRGCRPIAAGSLPAAYLAGRGCPLPGGDVLWHPALRHPCGHTGPALVAVVTDALTGRPVNLHRTWLAPDGGGKADVPGPRRLLKGHRKRGGVVRLFPDEELATGLCVAEGLETALSAARGFRPAWACLDAGNLAALPILPGVEALTIVADHDRPNPRTGRRAGMEAAEACARRWVEAGVEVRTWTALDEGADLNDFVRGRAA